MNPQIAAAWGLLPDYLGQHVLLSAAALGLGIAIGLPLVLLGVRRPRLRWPLLAVAGLVQTIPGLALLALFYPLLLGLSALTARAFGFEVQALGFLPSLLALTLYSMLPILRNGITGFTGLDPALIEAADGIGMTARQKLFLVELPLAAPVLMAGIRTAAVWTIGAATLSTPVGQTSLGNYIFSGLQTENWVFVLFGCAASALLAFVVDLLLGLIETAARLRDPRRLAVGLVVLLAGTALAAAPLLVVSTSPNYVVGAKNFSEQFILAEMMQARIEREGARVARRDGLGSAIAFRALAAGDVDAYVDYSGTLWANVLGRRDHPPRGEMLAILGRELKARYGVTVLGPLGFENAYALAMTQKSAHALGVKTLDDLAKALPRLRFGADLEFLDRPEYAEIRTSYGLNFRSLKSYNPTFMYRALAGGDVDVISAFSSDGRIAAQHLVILADPRHAVPGYDALILLSPKRGNDPLLRRALTPMLGRIAVARMQEANLLVDRDVDKRSPAEAARSLAAAVGLR
jgi:osmoprotectant transport system permease protein